MEKLPFDYRRVFSAMNRNAVSYLLVGGLNYFLAHKPVTTQDIDLLIDDTTENRSYCENALADLFAEWGRRDEDWGPVCAKPKGWLWGQNVFCLLTQFGPVDIFLSLPGISSYAEAKQESIAFQVVSRRMETTLQFEKKSNLPASYVGTIGGGSDRQFYGGLQLFFSLTK